MAYNKTKHLNAAQKYLVQGKMPQAILEYQQILKNEPKDQVTLMTLGDLFVRQGETFQALEYFERLAKIYLNDGFTTKAIAIYKKVAKLAPEEGRPLERLAELYVQQGVLSEARPIYLQLAEVQLKAGKQPQAVALFRKLLEAEPDNLRVQTRLAELLLSMAQQKEAIETFHAALQRLLDRGDSGEAIRLADRILQLDPQHQPTCLLKVRALQVAGKTADAAKLLETFPDREEGGETTWALLGNYLDSRQAASAVALAEKVFARDPKKYEVAHKVAGAVLETGDLDRARAMINLIRDTMIDSGEHDALAQTIARLVERDPGHVEPLEWLVDLYGRASDSFRLPDALAQLASAYEASGDEARALATLEKLLERTPEDESARRKYVRLRQKAGLGAVSGEIASPVKVAPTEAEAKPAPAPRSEPTLDEETQRYITQALTDVDLFSSYGLAQKAIDLLESVLERAPRHAPVLERLLDLSVGASSDSRTAELAALLEEIAMERNDRPAAERYAEFRRRFQRAAGLAPATETQPAAQHGTSAPQEFSVPVIQAQLDEPVAEAEPPSEPPPVEPVTPLPVESAVHEVDLSDEWAALSVQLETTLKEEASSAHEVGHEERLTAQEEAVSLQAASPPAAPQQAPPRPTAPKAAVPKSAPPLPPAPPVVAQKPAAPQVSPQPVAPKPAAPKPVSPPAAPIPVDAEEPVEAKAEVSAEAPAFDLELQPVPPEGAPAGEQLRADALLQDLAQDLESITSSLGIPEVPAPAAPQKPEPVSPAAATSNAASARPASGNGTTPGTTSPTSPLGDLFEEFRSEMGESGIEDEDPETHYSLGVAYREMGLLEEAISEFQKVANLPAKAPAFRYAMQCSTLLGLAFMEKGQPAIAAIWYERALKTPGLDQETILALKYDLGVAQELAGNAKAAFESFSQVYAMNIDYRDVSERIALLGKAR